MAKTKPMIPRPTKIVEVIPQDLKDQWSAIEACATTCNVLDVGHYPHQYLGAVRAARAFTIKLHEQSVEKALEHPQAHMISELKDLKKQKDVANGKAQETN